MTDTVRLEDVLDGFRSDHEETMRAGGEALTQGVAKALAMVPSENVAWAIVQRHPVLLLRSGATLFQVRLDAEENTATLTSRPLHAEQLAVGLDWGRSNEQDGAVVHEMRWMFRYVGVVGEEEWQRIVGRVTVSSSGEVLDRRERFARDLATQAGWTPPAGGA